MSAINFPVLGRQPLAYPLAIDWSNPITKGLVFCAVPLGNQMVDLVSGKMTGAFGANVTPGVNAAGVATKFSGSQSSGSCSFGNLTVANGYRGVTAEVYGKLSNDSKPFAKWGNGNAFLLSSSGSSILWVMDDTAGNRSRFDSASGAITGQQQSVICTFSDSGTVANNGKIYVNGVSVSVTNNGTSATGVGTKDSALWQLGIANDGGALNGSLNVARFWIRTLTPNEARSLSDNPWQIFIAKPALYFQAAQTGSNVTLALTGSSATFSSGTVSVSSNSTTALSGSSSTFNSGSVTATDTCALTGSGSAFSSGSVTVTDTVALAGSSASFSSGSVAVEGVSLSGSEATFSSGTVSVSITVPLVGSSASAISGTLSVTDSVPASGSQASFASGTVSVTATVALFGSSAAFSSGNVNLGSATIQLSGSEATFGSGSVSVPSQSFDTHDGGHWRKEKKNRVQEEIEEELKKNAGRKAAIRAILEDIIPSEKAIKLIARAKKPVEEFRAYVRQNPTQLIEEDEEEEEIMLLIEFI